MRRSAVLAAVLAAVLIATAPAGAASRAVGSPSHGRLIGGVPLAGESPWWFTWHFADRASPNPAWRRYGTERLVATVERVLTAYEQAHPDAARIGVGDLSPKGGGPFPPEPGSVGHSSHQNGLDADVLFPRRDGCECAPDTAADVDRALAQDLVDRLAAAGGVQYLFVGPSLHLRGPGAWSSRCATTTPTSTCGCSAVRRRPAGRRGARPRRRSRRWRPAGRPSCADQSETPASARVRTGVRRTSHSSGTALRRPNSSARSAPM